MKSCPKVTNNRRVGCKARNVLPRMRMLLFRAILATLGVGSLVSGLQEAVYGANLTVLSQPESGLSTLSDESLLGLEHRSYAKDYSTILSDTKPATEWKPILLSHDTEAPVVQVPPILLDLMKKVEVNTGGSSLDSEELVNVRYRMNLS
jgi:hypothetical protein